MPKRLLQRDFSNAPRISSLHELQFWKPSQGLRRCFRHAQNERHWNKTAEGPARSDARCWPQSVTLACVKVRASSALGLPATRGSRRRCRSRSRRWNLRRLSVGLSRGLNRPAGNGSGGPGRFGRLRRGAADECSFSLPLECQVTVVPVPVDADEVAHAHLLRRQ
jgi:hypothetical protein